MSFFKNKWVWAGVIAVAIGGYVWYTKSHAVPDAFTTTRVERSDIARTVSASATLVADQEIDLNFERTGRVASLVTSVGKSVSVGDAVAKLQSADADAEVARTKALLDQARANAGLNDDATREAEHAADDAKQYYDTVKDVQDQTVDAADKAYDNSVQYEAAVEDYYNQIVSDEGAGSAQAKSAKMSLIAATNAREAADEARDSARRNREANLQSAENTWSGLKQKLKTVESAHQNQSVDAAVAAAEAGYRAALAALDTLSLKAPVNGVITQLNYQKGEVIGSAASKPFGRLLSSDMLLEAKIPESDVAAAALGQAASVTFDALGPDASFQASVISIDPESTVVQDVVYYKVKLRLSVIDARLKPGMSCDVEIHISESKNALSLPTRAVKQEGALRYVEVKSADDLSAERRSVKVGIEGSDSRTEILSGVGEGDEVILEKKK